MKTFLALVLCSTAALASPPRAPNLAQLLTDYERGDYKVIERSVTNLQQFEALRTLCPRQICRPALERSHLFEDAGS